MDKYLANKQACNYSLAKFEILMVGPIFRHIDGVTMTFCRSDKNIVIATYLDFNVFTLVEIIFYLTTDPATHPRLSINGETISLDLSDEEFINKIVSMTSTASASIIVSYPSVAELDYENGCIIYAVVPGFPEEYFMNLELNN
jgi:hypothetical protein